MWVITLTTLFPQHSRMLWGQASLSCAVISVSPASFLSHYLWWNIEWEMVSSVLLLLSLLQLLMISNNYFYISLSRQGKFSHSDLSHVFDFLNCSTICRIKLGNVHCLWHHFKISLTYKFFSWMFSWNLNFKKSLKRVILFAIFVVLVVIPHVHKIPCCK